MRITAYKNKQVLILSIASGLIFFGFNAAEQHFTPYYKQIGLSNQAFNALAILYGSIIIGSFIGPFLVRRIGIRLALILGYLTYVALVLGITLKIVPLVYGLSSLLGVGAGVAGIARIDFIRLIAPVSKRGEFNGAIETVRVLGGFLGVALVSLILQFLTLEQIFILLGLIMLIGVGLFLFLRNPDDLKTAEVIPGRTLVDMVRLVGDARILLLLPFSIAGGFILGLVLGKIPVLIEGQFGVAWVGIVTSVFHLTLGLSLISGYISDIKGRFVILYSSLVLAILALLVFLNFVSIPALLAVMILLGLSGAMAGVLGALMLDLFEEKIKEASSVLGNLSIILGVVPSFLLPQVLSQRELFGLGIILCLLSMITLFILQVRKKQWYY